MKTNRLIVTSAFAFVLALTGLASACKVPVFRYALERWPADKYSIVAVIDGQVSGDTAEAIANLKAVSESDVNLVVEVIDLTQLSEAELWSVDGLESTDQTPMLQVFFPDRSGVRKLCWSGALTPSNVNAWIDSPIRRKIVDDLQRGMTAVWVIVESGDESKDTELMATLENQLAIASETITIPNGVIKREDATVYLKDNPGASMDDVLRCDIPLQIKFSIQRVRHGDQDELALRTIAGDLAGQAAAPYAFPIFGRGRMIEPLAASKFHEDAVTTACRYLVGECSCSVKALNPGVDLILKANWQDKLGDQVVMVDSSDWSKPQSIPIPAGHDTPDTDDQSVADNIPSDKTANDNTGKYLLIAMTLLGGLAFTIKLRMG